MAATRRQTLLWETATSDAEDDRSNGRWSRVGEATGECVACCCCPCGMMHLLSLAVYRLPAGIWRKKKRRRSLRTKRKILSQQKDNQREKNYSFNFYTDNEDDDDELGKGVDNQGENRAVEWEKEMWERFYTAGFWRSPSQRDDDDND